MENSTPGTTVVPNEDGQQPSPQQQQQAPADQQTIPQDQTPSTPNDNSGEGTPQVVQNDDESQNNGGQSDDIAAWAEKQGIDLDNPTPEQTRTLAKRLRDTQKSFHAANSRAKNPDVDLSKVQDLYTPELPTDDEYIDPDTKAMREATAKVNGQLSVLQLQQFIASTPEANEYAGKMVEILETEKATYGDAAARALSNNHKRLLALAKAESLDQETSQAYTQGRQEERQNIAHAQQAAGPASHAVTSAPQSNVVTDKQIGEMSTAEYTAWKAAGNNPWTVPSTAR